MIINGVDTDAITPMAGTVYPSVVEGRLLQLDADALIYKCTFNDDEAFATARDNFMQSLEHRLKMSGSVGCNLHLTGKSKGGRYGYATVKQYQGNRVNKVKPKNHEPLLQFLLKGLEAPYYVMHHTTQEADDGMAQANFSACRAGYPELSVIMAEDKDLTMCSGYHCNWDTYEVNEVKGFGSIYLDDTKSTKKIKGFGTSFFWAQLLTGDPADTIPGLEKLGGEMCEEFKPGKRPNPKRKPSLIGPALAWEVLKDVKNDHEALIRVLHAYKSYYPSPHTYTAWHGEEITRESPAQMLYEQAQLLWMRRVIGEQPSAWFKDVIAGLDWRQMIEE